MSDPFGGAFDPRMFANVPLFRELGKVMSWTGGPINWDLARDAAVSLSTPQGLPASTSDRSGFVEAVGVAELWLDQVTELSAIDGPAVTMTADEWTRQAASSTGLGVYLEPVAGGMTASLAEGLPEELSAFGPSAMQAMTSLSAFLYGMSAAQVVGQLASHLLGVYDLGVPTLDPRVVATVGDTAQRFADDYEFDQIEFTYWLALREAVHRRMFAGVRWLQPAVADLIAQFASQSSLDIQQMLDSVGGMALDPSKPEALRDALSAPDAFRVQPTAEQRTTLQRLQAVLSFVEGYSSTTIAAAAADKLT